MKKLIGILILIFGAGVFAQSGTGFPVWPFVPGAVNNDTSVAANKKRAQVIRMNEIDSDYNHSVEVIPNTLGQSPDNAPALPAFSECGQFAFYCLHTGKSIDNQLEIFTPTGVKILGEGVSSPNDVGMNCHFGDPEVQIVKVPNRSDEWYIIYNLNNSNFAQRYEPTKLAYSRVKITNLCDSIPTLVVVDRDSILNENNTEPVFLRGKAIDRNLRLFVAQRTSCSAGSFSLYRFRIEETDIIYDSRSNIITDDGWNLITDIIEINPATDTTEVAVLMRRQGIQGDTNGCNNITSSSKPLIYIFNSNSLDQTETIDFTDCKISGFTNNLGNDISIRDANNDSTFGPDNANDSNTNLIRNRHLRNFWRKIATIEFSSNGEFIYFTNGGYVLNNLTNYTYLGQIDRANNNLIRMQCQRIPDANSFTGGNINSFLNSVTNQYYQNSKMIVAIESSIDGNLYFTKTNTDTLFVLPNPNNPLPVNLAPHQVNFEDATHKNIPIQGYLTGAVLDQIDGYSYTTPNSGNVSFTVSPGTTVNCGQSVTLTRGTDSDGGSFSVVQTVPSGLHYSFTGNSAISTLIPEDPGTYTIKYESITHPGCCMFRTINVTCNCCCDIDSLKLSDPTIISVADKGEYYQLTTNFPISFGTPTMIQKVRASIVSFEASYQDPDCAKCFIPYTTHGTFLLENKTGSLPNFNGLQVVEQGYWQGGYGYTSSISTSSELGVREIIWSGNPIQMNGTYTQTLQFLIPKPRAIWCCQIIFKACVKFVFEDSDCKVCELYTCFGDTIANNNSQNHQEQSNCECGNGGEIRITLHGETLTRDCYNNNIINLVDNNIGVSRTYTPIYSCQGTTPECQVTHNYHINRNGTILVGPTSFSNSFTYTPTQVGVYEICIESFCNGQFCATCCIQLRVGSLAK